MNSYPFDFLKLAEVSILQISFEAYLSATAYAEFPIRNILAEGSRFLQLTPC